MIKLKLVCRTSKKGNEYVALCSEKDGRETFLTFDIHTIARATGYSLKELYTMESGTEINL